MLKNKAKVFCTLCKFDNIFSEEFCFKVIDNRISNMYNGVIISGESNCISLKENEHGECPYYEPKKKEAWFERWF